MAKKITDAEIKDTLGLEIEYNNYNNIIELIKQARELIGKGYKLDNIWLSGDINIYVKGKIIDKTADLIVVEEME